MSIADCLKFTCLRKLKNDHYSCICISYNGKHIQSNSNDIYIIIIMIL